MSDLKENIALRVVNLCFTFHKTLLSTKEGSDAFLFGKPAESHTKATDMLTMSAYRLLDLYMGTLNPTVP